MTVAQQKLKTEKLSDYYTWVRAIWLTSRGDPLDFETRKYLVDIYRDQYKDIVYMKSSQMGLSERMISEAVWIAEQMGVNVLYVFPAQKQLQEFVQARLNPVLAMSDYLKSKIESDIPDAKRVETLSLKRVGRGYIYFRGSQNVKQIVSVDADCVILDERDRFEEKNVPYIDKRMLASKLKWRREVSTPTIPGMGIHKAYLKSDRRIWQIKCRRCGEWQELDFFKNINFKRKKVICAKCKRKIYRLDSGRWVITNPDGKVHGYKINGMYNPAVTIPELVDKYREAKISGFAALQQFFNQDIGMPYEVKGQSIQISELDSCKKDYMFPLQAEHCYAGIDIGVEIHHGVVLQRKQEGKNEIMKLVWAGTVSKFFGPQNSIEAILDRYKVVVAVIDKKPETAKVKEMMDRFPGKVYATDYPTMKFSVKKYFLWDDIKRELRLDRTISLDYLIGDIQNQRLELPKNIELVKGFYKQLRASARITEKNKQVKWIEKGADHYLHALNFARMAVLKGGKGKALLDYYKEPLKSSKPGLLDWIRINAQRMT